MWIEGNPIVTNDGTFIYFGNGHAYWNNAEQCMQVENLLKVEPETVGQFTGLLDMNGKKIFEGDIFSLGDPNILYIVQWHDTGFSGKQIRSTSYVGLSYWRDRIEIVGNIHDNPELLEVK